MTDFCGVANAADPDRAASLASPPHRRPATPDSCRHAPTARARRHCAPVVPNKPHSTRCAATKSTHDKWVERGAVAPRWGTYDGLDRLIGTQRANPAASTLAFAYDLSGNRTGKTVNGASTSYTTPAASNRLTSLAEAEARSFAYDSAGNQTGAGGITYGYDNAGRRTSATVNGQAWLYAYNAFGQRVRKTGGGTTTLYAYDDQGHLLGEYDGQGRLIQETVWLGDVPVATLRLPAGAASGPAHPFHVHADHLNTPRRITRPADNKVLWQWESEPFGDSPPNGNPQGLGAFAYNLRFPGQLFDPETGTHYNFFRDYEPNTGRYSTADPIGLASGSMSLYSYADNAPTMKTDPLGLQALPIPLPLPPPAGGAANDPVFGPTHGGGGGCPPDCGEFKKRLDDTYIALQRAKRTSGLLMNATFNTLHETYFWVSVRNYQAQCGPYTPPYPQEPDPDSIHDFYGK